MVRIFKDDENLNLQEEMLKIIYEENKGIKLITPYEITEHEDDILTFTAFIEKFNFRATPLSDLLFELEYLGKMEF